MMAEPSYYVREITSAMKRELPSDVVCTVGPCSRCKTEAARGSGVCLACRTKELGKLIGNDLLARRYRSQLEAVQQLERRLVAAAEDNEGY